MLESCVVRVNVMGQTPDAQLNDVKALAQEEYKRLNTFLLGVPAVISAPVGCQGHSGVDEKQRITVGDMIMRVEYMCKELDRHVRDMSIQPSPPLPCVTRRDAGATDALAASPGHTSLPEPRSQGCWRTSRSATNRAACPCVLQGASHKMLETGLARLKELRETLSAVKPHPPASHGDAT